MDEAHGRIRATDGGHQPAREKFAWNYCVTAA